MVPHAEPQIHTLLQLLLVIVGQAPRPTHPAARPAAAEASGDSSPATMTPVPRRPPPQPPRDPALSPSPLLRCVVALVMEALGAASRTLVPAAASTAAEGVSTNAPIGLDTSFASAAASIVLSHLHIGVSFSTVAAPGLPLQIRIEE